MSKVPKRLKKYQLALVFALVIFLILVTTMMLMILGVFILDRIGITSNMPVGKGSLVSLAVVSIVVGTIIAMTFSRIPLAPLREIMTATDRLAEGDFNARINLQGPEDLQKLNASFNHMAQELGSLEMLRADFVNNFSHEFKTPIVSLRGFAKILKYDDLTREERDEYLDIIINESERLADLATNVLNLSKLENQTSVTDKVRFNGSEQLRRVIALLQRRWAEKNITIHFDCGEIDFYGSAELLSQVWTNLLDNAIKFSPEHSTITVEITENPAGTVVRIADQGSGISPDILVRIFDKFYQGDTSHATKGNGIGLTLVKRIVRLHGGRVFVKSGRTGSVFEVTLPRAG